MGALDTAVSIHQHISGVSMRLTAAFLLVGGLALTNGAVIPSASLHKLMTSPGAFADALSNLRVKRNADGKIAEFKFHGADVKLEYLAEDANSSVGSKIAVTVENLDKSFGPQSPKMIKLVVRLDKGSGSSVIVDYELHHQTTETGKFIFKTSLDVNTFYIESSLHGEGGDAVHARLIPDFGFHLKTDAHTFVEGSVTLPTRHKYFFKLSRRGIEQFVLTGHQSVEEQQKPAAPGSDATDPTAIFKLGLAQLVNSASTTGPNYKVQLDIDYQSKIVSLQFLKNTEKLIDGKFRIIANPPEAIEIKLNALVKGPGQLDAKVGVYGDTLELKATRNDEVIIAAKGKVAILPAGAKAELKYTGISEGKIQAGATQFASQFEKKLEFNFYVLPNSGIDLKIDASQAEFANRTKINAISITRNKEVYLDSFRKIVTPMPKTPRGFEYFEENNLHVSNKSIFYSYNCLFGCFNDRSAITKVSIANLRDWSKLSYSFNSVRDGVNDMAIELKTDSKPIHFKFLEPAFLPKLVGQESIDVNIDFEPNKHLTLKTNLNHFQSVAITMKGNTFEVSFMDKKLFSGTVTPGNKQVAVEIITFDKKTLKVTLSWEKPYLGNQPFFDKNVFETRVQYESNVDAKLKVDWDYYAKKLKVEAEESVSSKSLALVYNLNDGSLTVGA